MKSIVHVPNDVLTSPSGRITAFDKKLLKLIADMKKTLTGTTNPRGVGLAAVQIGEPYAVFITKPSRGEPLRVFINPEVLERTESAPGAKGHDNKLEGCLSIPNIWGKVTRSPRIKLRYQDEQGTIHEEVFQGFFATILQHETDHTNGILFTQRVLEQQGKLYQQARDKEGKSVLEEIRI